MSLLWSFDVARRKLRQERHVYSNRQPLFLKLRRSGMNQACICVNRMIDNSMRFCW